MNVILLTLVMLGPYIVNPCNARAVFERYIVNPCSARAVYERYIVNPCNARDVYS